MLEKTNLKSVGRHLQRKAGPQHRCLCGPQRPVHRFSQTLQVPEKAWRGQGEQEAPRAFMHTTYDLPPGQGRPLGLEGRGPEPLPHSSPSPDPTGSRPSSAGQQHRVERKTGVQTPVAGGGERQPPSKPVPGLTHPISPRTRALRAHSQPSDQKHREEVWRCSGLGLMVTEAI